MVTEDSLIVKMEREFEEFLDLAGAHKDTLSVLENENVVSLSIFKALRDEHFGRLLPRMTVGQHVLLLNAWEDVHMPPDGPPDPKKVCTRINGKEFF